MAVFELDIDSTDASFIQETQLEGTTYRFLFRWNSRESFWYMSLLDLDDNEIRSGIKLVPSGDLLRHVADLDARPPGSMFVLGTPTRYGLGTEQVITYVESE